MAGGELLSAAGRNEGTKGPEGQLDNRKETLSLWSLKKDKHNNKRQLPCLMITTRP